MTFEELKDLCKNYLIENAKSDGLTDASVNFIKTPTYTGVCIKNDSSAGTISPALNLDDLFKKHKDGFNEEAIRREVSTFYKLHALPALKGELPSGLEGISADLKNIVSDYNNLKSKLYISVVKDDPVKLAELPHKPVCGDLAIIYRLCVKESDINNNDLIFASALVTNSMIEKLNITPDTLHDDAMRNSPFINPMDCKELGTFLNELGAELGVSNEYDNEPGMPFVLTSKSHVNGAALMFYEGVAEDLESTISTDFFIVPSSIHEVLIQPFNETKDMIDDMNMIIRDINEQLDPKEVLSDHLYMYDSVKKEIVPMYSQKDLDKLLENRGKDISL